MNLNRKGIWAVVGLIGLYVTCQLIADVGATKFVSIGSFVLPGGSFIFALTFTVRDMVHKRLGKEWARAAILLAAAFNVLMSVYFWAIARVPAPPFFELGDAWDAIFAIVPSIVIGSILAEVVSEWVDTEVYHVWYLKMIDKKGWPQWTSVVASNVVSLPIDSLIFGTFAFTILPLILGGESLPVIDSLKLVQGQIVWKALVTVVSMPAIYLVPRKPIVGV